MIHLRPLLEEQIRALHKPRPTLIFPEGDDPRVLAAASYLDSVADIVLLTTRERVIELVERGEATLETSLRRFLASVRFVMPGDDQELLAELREDFWVASKGKRWAVPRERLDEIVRDPAIFACMAVRRGHADAVLGGARLPSRDFFRPALRLLNVGQRAFEVGFFSLPDTHPEQIYQQNLVAFADVAVNPDPDAHTLARIAVGACQIVRDLIPPTVLPHVNGAMLSYSTKGSGQGPSVARIRDAGRIVPTLLAELVARDPLYASIRIESELQISVAISMAAAKDKLRDALGDPDSPVGRAGVLITPSLDAGNLLYHLYATRYADSERLLMVGGMSARVLDFSRSSTARDVVLGGIATVLRLSRRPDFTGTPRDTFFRRYRVLVLNPGSTSTKVAAYQGRDVLFDAEVAHPAEELAACPAVFDQLTLRERVVRRALDHGGVSLDSLDAVVGRGGLVRPVASGTYAVSEAMLADLRAARFGEHASNLGPALAHALAAAAEAPAFTVDPVVVDELSDVARLTGLAGYERQAAWHALSQKAVARRYADQRLRDYEALNLIVAHLGGGVTVGCHRKGRCVHVTHGLDEGPMTPERAGALPHSALLDLCFRQGLDERQVRRRLVGEGGLVSHLGTNDLRRVEELVEAGDERAALVFEALAQSVAAHVAAAIVRFEGEPVDRLILTGGMIRSDRLCARLALLLSGLGVGLTCYPGGLESEALRDGALRVMRGQEEALSY